MVIVVGMVMAVKTSENVMRLWKAGKGVENTRIKVKEAEKENESLKKRLFEVRSDDFVEREARDKLGMGKEGEMILILPEMNKLEASSAKDSEERQETWRKWWNLYFRPKE
jgi:hypothetical protein